MAEKKTLVARMRRVGWLGRGSAAGVSVSRVCSFVVAWLLMGSGAADCVAATTFVKWTFERTQPTGGGPYAAETNTPAKTTAATLNGVTGQGTNTVIGNGSSYSLGAQGWDVNDYYEFKLSTTGYQNISVSFAQTSSSTGPRDFAFTFSTDGGASFTQFGAAYVLTGETWSSSAPNTASIRTMNLSSYAALTNQDVVIFRLMNTSAFSTSGGTTGMTGTSRVDDFTVLGDVASTPEPATCVGGALLLGTLGWRCLRRRTKLG